MQKFYEEQTAAMRAAMSSTQPETRKELPKTVQKILLVVQAKASEQFSHVRNAHISREHIHCFPEALQRMWDSPRALLDDVVAHGRGAWKCLFTPGQTAVMADLLVTKYISTPLPPDPTPEQVARHDRARAEKAARITAYIAASASDAVVARVTERSATERTLADATLKESLASRALTAADGFHTLMKRKEVAAATALAEAKRRCASEQAQPEPAAKRPKLEPS